MSRIGNKVVVLPDGVSVKLEGNTFQVSGSKGKLSSPLFDNLEYKQEGNVATITRNNDSKELRALHGLARSLFANNVIGVVEGFKKDLEIQGVGYRCAVKGKVLTLNLGFSHEVNYQIPEDIDIEVKQNVKIFISGIDKQRVGQIAAEIRGLKPPEPYKGKGIRYVDETVKRKAGKTGKK